MNEQEKYFLSRDVFSIVRSTRLYGKKGDPVTVITGSAPVLIVENESGDRFPVIQEDLSKEHFREDNPRPEAEHLSNIIQKKPKKVIRKTDRPKKDDSLSLF